MPQRSLLVFANVEGALVVNDGREVVRELLQIGDRTNGAVLVLNMDQWQVESDEQAHVARP
jgi:hypothetical protein